MNRQNETLSIDSQIFDRMRGDIDLRLRELTETMLEMGQTSGRLNLRLDIHLYDAAKEDVDEHGECIMVPEYMPSFDYKITTKAEAAGKSSGTIPAASSCLRKEQDGTLTLEQR